MSGHPNQKLKGLRRDNEILRTIELWGTMNTEQVQAKFFRYMRYGQRKAQEVLLRLYRNKRLQRSMVEGVYCYYLDKQGMVKHLLGVNWVRLWMMQSVPSWEKFHSWNYEQDYKVLRCDGFAVTKNNATGKFKFTFVEMDRGTNAFDKIKKYNKLYEEEKHYSGSWWVSLTERFPTILIVTVSPERKRLIQSLVEAENVNGLEFKVELLDDMRKEVMDKCYSPLTPAQDIMP